MVSSMSQPAPHPPLPYAVARAERRCQRCLGEYGVPRLVGLKSARRPDSRWQRALLCATCAASAGEMVVVLRLI